MTIQGTPYQPEVDTRFDTLETDGDTLRAEFDSVAAGKLQILAANRETVSAIGATLSASKLFTIINCTGGGAMVLPAPSQEGQKKFINCTAANNSVTIALTNVNYSATAFIITAAGGTLNLESVSGTKWEVISTVVAGNGKIFV